MQRYGVENVNDHFMAFNTICDATQVVCLFQLICQFAQPKVF